MESSELAACCLKSKHVAEKASLGGKAPDSMRCSESAEIETAAVIASEMIGEIDDEEDFEARMEVQIQAEVEAEMEMAG